MKHPVDPSAAPVRRRRAVTSSAATLAAAALALTLGAALPASAATAGAPAGAVASSALVVPGAVTATRTATRAAVLPQGVPVRLVAKGWHRDVVAAAPATVGELLSAQKVAPDSDDRTLVGPASAKDAAAGVAATVTVQKVTVAKRTTKTKDPRKTVTKHSSTRYKTLGTLVQRAGRSGTRTTVTRVTTVDGTVTARKKLSSHTTAVSRVVVVGTRKSPKHATVGYSKAIAKDLVRRKGWSSAQYTCVVKLWERESNWRVSATNRSSGAAGIPQALPGRKMASAGPAWRTNPKTQITWGLGYIKSRYGTPCKAWSHSQRTGWY